MKIHEMISFINEVRRRGKTTRGLVAARKAGFMRSNVYRSLGDKMEPKLAEPKQKDVDPKRSNTKFRNRHTSKTRRRFYSYYSNTRAKKAARFTRTALQPLKKR